MTEARPTDQDVNRAIRSWLHEDRHEDASRVAGVVLDRAEATPQRRATWWPAWRMPNVMNKFVALGLGAAAVVAVLAIGMQFLPSAPGGVGVAPSASPSPTPAPTPEPTATPKPSPPPASAPPLTQSFTSNVHGISVSYPDGWATKPATEPWTAGTSLFPFGDPQARADFLYDATLQDSLFLAVGSQPIGDATPEDWLVKMGADPSECPATEPITVGGATGLIGSSGSCHFAVVTTDGRGYWISLYRGDADPSYDRAWFEKVLATVQFHPEDAVDVTPSPTP